MDTWASEVEGIGQWPPPWFWKFQQEKVVFLLSSGKKQIPPYDPLEKFWKNPLVAPKRVFWFGSVSGKPIVSTWLNFTVSRSKNSYSLCWGVTRGKGGTMPRRGPKILNSVASIFFNTFTPKRPFSNMGAPSNLGTPPEPVCNLQGCSDL